MVRLFSVHGPEERYLTVWASDAAQARDLARQDTCREPNKIVDITSSQTDLENPYRAYALQVIAHGRTGIAHLRVSHTEDASGWVFRAPRQTAKIA